MKRLLFVAVVGCLCLSFSVSALAAEEIAFCRLTDGYWQLWVMAPDGKDQRQITATKHDKRDPAWMKDQSSLVFRTTDGKIISVNLLTGEEQEIRTDIKNINNICYSDRTGEMVFVSYNFYVGDVGNLWKYNLKDGTKQLLVPDAAMKFDPVISPHGDLIAFTKADSDKNYINHLWIMKSDGTQQRRLTQGDGRDAQPSFSPGQDRIVYATNKEDQNYELFVIDLNTGKERRLTEHSGLDVSPSFSPNADAIVFVSGRSGSQQIWTMNLKTGNVSQLTSGPAEALDPVWGEIGEEVLR